jgi:hypothetical protein
MTRFAQPLIWSKVKKQSRYALLDAHGAEIASVTFGKWNYTKASATTKDAAYQIEMRSWWKQEIVIMNKEGKEIGTYTPRWNMKGILELEGKTYTWMWNNFWGTQWKWTGAHNRDLMRFQLEGFWHISAKVEILENAGDDELLLMIMGGYLMYQSMANSSSGNSMIIAS